MNLCKELIIIDDLRTLDLIANYKDLITLEEFCTQHNFTKLSQGLIDCMEFVKKPVIVHFHEFSLNDTYPRIHFKLCEEVGNQFYSSVIINRMMYALYKEVDIKIKENFRNCLTLENGYFSPEYIGGTLYTFNVRDSLLTVQSQPLMDYKRIWEEIKVYFVKVIKDIGYQQITLITTNHS
jgi:hypothetical protein